MFSQLCHACVALSTGSLRRGGLIRGGGAGTVAANGDRRHKLPVRPPERRGLVPSLAGPVAGGRGAGVRRESGGRDGRRVLVDPVRDPLAHLRAMARKMVRRQKPDLLR